jgi:hypothetical protein
MTQKLQEVFGGRSPYHWQLDAAEALIVGLDCLVVAGIGAGKTILLALPLVVQDSPAGLGHISGEHPRNQSSEMSIGCLDPLTCRHALLKAKRFIF